MNAAKALLSALQVVFPLSLLAAQPSGYVVGWGSGMGAGYGIPKWLLATGPDERLSKSLDNAVSIAAGFCHGLALDTNGVVVAWGRIGGEPVTVPSGLGRVTAVAAGYNFCLALKANGTVAAWGENDRGQTNIPPDLTNAVAISAGGRHALALRADGTLTQWGRTASVRLPASAGNIVAVAAGGSRFERNLALKSDGTVIAWGAEDAPSGLTNITAVAAGENHSLALGRDGIVIGWGDNGSGEATGVAASYPPYDSTGRVMVAGQVLSNAVAIAAGNEFGLIGSECRYSIALKRDGTVVTWGEIRQKPAEPPGGLSNVVAIAAGQGFCLAITTNSAVAERFRR